MTALTEKQLASLPYIRSWLVFVAAMVFAMVIVGGATRLTDSGLSITEWKPLLGAIPPLNEADWLAALDKYRQIPEYQLINKGMSLAEFKFIYGGIYTISDQTLYSYRISVGNSTFIDLKLIGKKKMNDTVSSVRAIKQKGQNKMFVFYEDHRLTTVKLK